MKEIIVFGPAIVLFAVGIGVTLLAAVDDRPGALDHRMNVTFAAMLISVLWILTSMSAVYIIGSMS